MALRRFVSAATLVAMIAGACGASAQTFTLRLESDAPSTEYRVHAGKGAPTPWLTCIAPCEIAVTPGRHRIESSGPGFPKGETAEYVFEDTLVKTRAGDSTTKTVGLVVGLTGLGAVGVGLVGALLSDCFTFESTGCPNERSTQDTHAQKNAFEVVAIVGAVASVLGWVVYFGSDTSVSAKPLPMHRPRVLTVGVAPASGGGASVGMLGTF